MLLSAALGAAAAIAPAISFGQANARVGVLLPINERIPGMKLAWQQGFQAELIALDSHLQLDYVPYAVGSHRALAAAQLLLDQGCTTITGIFNRNLATHLSPSLEKHNANFLVSDLGANALRGNSTCARLARVGPNLWQHAYLAGQHAAAQGASNALIATSFYEAGYDLPGAFKQGFIDGGAQSAEIVVTGTPELSAGDDGFARITVALAANARAVDVLFSLYSGREASRYLRFARTLTLRVGRMMALSPLLHGMPRRTVADAPMTVVNASVSGVSRADESLYMAMGRVAARGVLTARGETCASDVAWQATVNDGSAASGNASTSVASQTLNPDACAPWQEATVSGWIAPYGA